MSAKEYREYADECMRSAKNSTLVKECRELSAGNFCRLRKLGFMPPTFWRSGRGARLLSSLIP
jgi:hypothetical protein